MLTLLRTDLSSESLPLVLLRGRDAEGILRTA